MNKRFGILFCSITFILSFVLGIISHDHYFLGSITLFLGCVQTYLTTKGKWYEALLGILGTLISIIICAITGLYGSIIFAVAVYIPLSIFNLINWKKHESNHVVNLKRMTVGKSLLTILIVTLTTTTLAWLLSLIPTQKLAFWDACSNILNVCGILLIALRYKEGWLVWILCNFVEVATWALALWKGYSPNAIMMIIKNIIYIGMNIWGYLSFLKLIKAQTTSTLVIDNQ